MWQRIKTLYEIERLNKHNLESDFRLNIFRQKHYPSVNQNFQVISAIKDSKNSTFDQFLKTSSYQRSRRNRRHVPYRILAESRKKIRSIKHSLPALNTSQPATVATSTTTTIPPKTSTSVPISNVTRAIHLSTTKPNASVSSNVTNIQAGRTISSSANTSSTGLVAPDQTAASIPRDANNMNTTQLPVALKKKVARRIIINYFIPITEATTTGAPTPPPSSPPPPSKNIITSGVTSIPDQDNTTRPTTRRIYPEFISHVEKVLPIYHPIEKTNVKATGTKRHHFLS